VPGDLGDKVFRVFRASCAYVIAFGLMNLPVKYDLSAQPLPNPVPQTGPVVSGIIRMPLVSPEQADQFFANRSVPQSAVPAQSASPSDGPPQRILGVPPMLGHELPMDAQPPEGLGRADFAVRKLRDDKDRTIADHPGTFRNSPTAVGVREEPPMLGKP